VEFGVEIGEYRGGVQVPAPVARAAHPRAMRRGVLPPEPGRRASPSGSCDGAS
jgi:hypothetical protein